MVALKEKEHTKYALLGGTALAGIRGVPRVVPPTEEEGVYALPGGVVERALLSFAVPPGSSQAIRFCCCEIRAARMELR